MTASEGLAARRWRRTAALLALVAAGAIGVALWALVELRRSRPGPAAVEPPPAALAEDRLLVLLAMFVELPGWSDDDLAAARPALARSCAAIARRAPDDRLGLGPVATRAGDWAPFCAGLQRLPWDADTAALRRLVEAELIPLGATNHGDATGLFTGYYEPTLAGSRRRSARFSVPLYLQPPDLVAVDLGEFRDELAGQRIAGRVRGSRLVPYDDRAAIEAGSLARRGLELVWVDDPIDAFFLHVQGSGRIELADGGRLRVGYAAQNGHLYFAIGRELVARGALRLEEVSMQSIRAWLAAHPAEARAVMAKNASYVFFRQLDEPGPVGTLGVVLTPGRSLAVDGRFLPLGAPVWVDTTLPATDTAPPDPAASPPLATPPPAPPPPTGPPLRRLFVAQDTGGAIRGPVRADLFWGPGREAAEIAGRMRQEGRLWLLVLRGSAPPLQSAEAGAPATVSTAPAE